MIYDIVEGYRDHDPHVVAVTDDLLWARSYILESIKREFGEMTAREFQCFEGLFEEFRHGTTRRLYFSLHDMSYEIRETHLRIAIGGMSTI